MEMNFLSWAIIGVCAEIIALTILAIVIVVTNKSRKKL